MMPGTDQNLTATLQAISEGQGGALKAVLPIIYERLRALAQDQLGREAPGHTLQPTALVHEAYLRLVDQRQTRWQSTAHFFAIAAQAMRRILIDHARARGAGKRGGGRARIPLADAEPSAPTTEVDIQALDEALTRLAAEDPLGAQVVEMRFFAGMEMQMIAEVLGVTDRTVRRHWVYAKAILTRELLGDTRAVGP
jgi:RNA polymerase sigma-70 factor, ECF subfamily